MSDIEWIETTVGEYCPFIYGKALPQSKRISGNIPVYGSNGIVDFHNSSCVNTAGVIIGRKGSVGAIHLSEKPFWAIDTAFYIVNDDLEELKFTYYLLKTLGLSEMNSDSAVPGLNRENAHSLKIKIPKDKFHRCEIGKRLSIFDQKIQLNTQINQTLEQIAQALFRSWFVDFEPVRTKVQALSEGMSLEQAELAAMQTISGKTPEELTALSQTQPEHYAELAETTKAFPCEMVEIDGVEVPKGWELSTIGDCYDVVMGQSPKGETYNENKQGMLFYQGRAEFGWRFPTPRLFTTDPKRIAEQNSILMSIRAPVGDINIALEKCCIGRGLAALQHKSKSLSFGLYQIQSIKPELDLFNGEGTVFGSINQANLKNIQIINPEEKFIQLFEKNLSSCDSKIMNNEIENNALKEIRDLLLPRLLSGEIQL
ncbi:TPA: restriction endonuclease subunit S [Haemophilus influenzae]|uniref:restriction endonuclease subunit S n=1 Tax=Haemophilus influenzae TaxID=727 RepID=UPI000DD41A2F|nr:restriction endonuclease subunit S [Haemophilus influenzae]